MTQQSPAPTEQAPVPAADSDTTSTGAIEPGFGWTRYAELINGRFAMVGFVALLILEFFTHQDFFTWIGLR
jgi:hypothetical protein